MALSDPTTLDALFGETGNSTTITSDTVSPTGDALLVVVATFGRLGDASDETLSISDTLTGTGTWSKVEVDGNVGSQLTTMALFYAQAGSSPGSGTVEVSCGTASRRRLLAVYEITGQDTSTPVPQTKSGSSTSSTPSLTLDSTPASDSLVFGWISSRDDGDGITPGSNFTELHDVEVGASQSERGETEYDKDSATTTVDWSDCNTDQNLMAAIEVAAAAGVTVVEGAATLAGTGTKSADALNIVLDEPELTATGTLTSDALLLVDGVAALSGTGTQTSDALVIVFTAPSLAGTGTLTASGTVISDTVVTGAATLSGSGTFTSDSLVIVLDEPTLSGSGSVTGDALVIVLDEPALTGAGTVTADAVLTVFDEPTIVGTGTMTVTGTVVTPGDVVLADVAVAGELRFGMSVVDEARTNVAVASEVRTEVTLE